MSRTYRNVVRKFEKNKKNAGDWKEAALNKNCGKVPDVLSNNTVIGNSVKIDDAGKPYYDHEVNENAYHEGPLGHKNKKKETNRAIRHFGKAQEDNGAASENE